MTRVLGFGAAVGLAYVITGLAGFSVAGAAEQVTTVWAPSGIAISALLLGGQRLWPAIWLGAFIVNASTHAPLWTACVIASGNTLEAVAAFRLLRRARVDDSLTTVRGVLAFVGIAACAATCISATVGVTTICAAGAQPWGNFAALWFDWWLGDALGALVVAPVILTLARPAARGAAIETLLFAIISTATSHFVLGPPLGSGGRSIAYAIFPVVVAAAMRSLPRAPYRCCARP